MSTRARKKDEGFTNIRIREETREELRAIGRYSENMDDIVRKCLAAYKAITSSGGRVFNKIVVEEPIKEQTQIQQQYQQPQSQLKGENPPLTTLKDLTMGVEEMTKDITKDSERVNKYVNYGKPFGMTLPGLKYPATKDEIVKAAKRSKTNIMPIVEALNGIPDKMYNSKRDIVEPFTDAYNNIINEVHNRIKEIAGHKGLPKNPPLLRYEQVQDIKEESKREKEQSRLAI
jgi:hypothetical protein